MSVDAQSEKEEMTHPYTRSRYAAVEGEPTRNSPKVLPISEEMGQSVVTKKRRIEKKAHMR